MDSKDLGLISNWLRNIRDVYRLHQQELDDIADHELRVRRLIELNVVEQCLNIYKTGIVQNQRKLTYGGRRGKRGPQIAGIHSDRVYTFAQQK